MKNSVPQLVAYSLLVTLVCFTSGCRTMQVSLPGRDKTASQAPATAMPTQAQSSAEVSEQRLRIRHRQSTESADTQHASRAPVAAVGRFYELEQQRRMQRLQKHRQAVTTVQFQDAPPRLDSEPPLISGPIEAELEQPLLHPTVVFAVQPMKAEDVRVQQTLHHAGTHPVTKSR